MSGPDEHGYRAGMHIGMIFRDRYLRGRATGLLVGMGMGLIWLDPCKT